MPAATCFSAHPHSLRPIHSDRAFYAISAQGRMFECEMLDRDQDPFDFQIVCACFCSLSTLVFVREVQIVRGRWRGVRAGTAVSQIFRTLTTNRRVYTVSP